MIPGDDAGNQAAVAVSIHLGAVVVVAVDAKAVAVAAERTAVVAVAGIAVAIHTVAGKVIQRRGLEIEKHPRTLNQQRRQLVNEALHQCFSTGVPGAIGGVYDTSWGVVGIW